MVDRAAFRAADGIEPDAQILQPQRPQHVQRQRNHFRIACRLRRAEHLAAKLMVLAQAAALRRFVAKNRRVEVIHLHRQHARVQAVLHQRAHRARGSLRLEGHRAMALVLEGVHFLLHDVGGVAHAPQKQLGVFKHGRAYLAETRPRGDFAHDGLHRLPFPAVLRQHVLGAPGSLCQHSVFSFRSVYKTALAPMGRKPRCHPYLSPKAPPAPYRRAAPPFPTEAPGSSRPSSPGLIIACRADAVKPAVRPAGPGPRRRAALRRCGAAFRPFHLRRNMI